MFKENTVAFINLQCLEHRKVKTDDMESDRETFASILTGGSIATSNMSNSKANVSGMAYSFNVLFFRRFLHMFKVMFPSCKSSTLLLFVSLLFISLLEQVVVYNVGLLPSKYYKVLGDRDQTGFQSLTLFALLLVASIAFIKSTHQFLCRMLYIYWRKFIDQYIHKVYFKDVLYYNINVLDEEVDNPDQRITQDVDKLCNQLSQIIADLIVTPFTMGYYMYQCASVTGYLGPVGVLGFFLVSSVINKFLMSPVVNFVYRQERLEGDFRFKHMQMRSNAESAAFLRVGSIEHYKADCKLHSLINTQQRLYLREYALNISVNLADYLGSILSYLLLAIPILGGAYSHMSGADLSSLISKNSFVIMYLINCFTKLIDMAVKVTDIAGNTHRVTQLVEKLHQLEAEQILSGVDFNGDVNPAWSSSNTSIEKVRVAYEVREVTYSTPIINQVLVKDLSLRLVTGTNILVTGESGCGKSSLYRVLDGLWPVVRGELQRNIRHGPTGVMFLPQKPFFTDGTLREQIVYPLMISETHDSCITDGEIIQHLHNFGLSSILDRVGGLDVPVAWNWYDVLSPGEMQRISFIRLFYHRPPFALLDEATSQVDLSAERHLYTTCQSLNITLVSVGHRDSLREFHDQELHLDGSGSYSITDIQ